MAASYEALKTPLTRTQVLEALLAIMALPDFDQPVTSYGPTDEPYAVLAADADVLATLSEVVAGMAKSGILEDAEGDVLEVHTADVFDETRIRGVNTIGTVTLTESLGTPWSFGIGEIVFRSATDASRQYRNTAAVSLSALGSTSFSIAAEDIGSAGNVQASDLQLVTALPGVTLSAAAGTAWITQPGTNDESDAALRLRCRLKWGTLTTTGPADAYKKWALEADPSITRVAVWEDPGPVYGDPAVTIQLATRTGTASPAAITAVTAYIEARRPLGIVVAYYGASPSNFDLKGPVSVKAAKRAAAEAWINTTLAAWFEGDDIEINGETIEGLTFGSRVRISQVVEIVMSAPGVVAFTPKKADGTTTYAIEADDKILGINEIATLVLALTYTEV